MSFFKETALYKEMRLLEFISNNKNISQHDIAQHIDAAVSMTNTYIDNLETEGYLLRNYQSKKIVHYNITQEGLTRKQYLQIRYVKELMDMYLRGQNTIDHFLGTIEEKSFQKILFYGAGDVASILLNMIEINNYNLKVVAIIDDSMEKIGTTLYGIEVISCEDLDQYNHDGIVITSFTYEEKILKRLKDCNYPEDKIVKYFERG